MFHLRRLKNNLGMNHEIHIVIAFRSAIQSEIGFALLKTNGKYAP